ncbi:MAG: hypothetical protein QOE66_1130, partial [Chloroflexota bacterium]|nr:hypothetical protein [Chloroflexota bacterium]
LRGACYPSFGRPHDGLGFGPEMLTHDHGSTAISGISYYAADHFPEPYRGTIFIGNVMTNRINHDRLEWHGSTPKAIAQPDFLRSDDNWFRPVDIELGPDGALYVADFYNRIIGHYEVPLTHPGRDRERGRIWRIVYRGPEGKQRPVAPRGDGPQADRGALIDDLGHPNLAVRLQAANQLVDRPPDATLKTIANADENPWRRVHALWVLQRQGLLDEDTLKAAAGSREGAVRVHAQRVLGERTELPGPLRDLALHGLTDEDAQVRRNAAEALGRHPDPANIRPLLDLRQAAPSDDTHLIHVVRMALRDQLLTDPAWDSLEAMPRSERDDRDVADVAVGVPSAAAARFLFGRIRRVSSFEGVPLLPFIHHIARHGADATGSELTAFLNDRRDQGPTWLATLLKALQQGLQERGASPGDESRTLALETARALLDSAKGEEVKAGISLAGPFTLRELQDRLAMLAGNPAADAQVRTSAMTALATIAPQAAVAVLGPVLGDPSVPIALRTQAAGALASSAQPGAEAALLAALPTAPGQLQTVIAAGLAARPAGARALLDAVAAGKASARVLQDIFVAAALNQSKLPDLKERLDPLLKGLPPSDQRLRDLLARRRARFETSARDPAEGAKVFEKNCMACHQLRGQGARIGPQLDGIGVRGVERLLEDILDPNRNVDQAFRTTQLALTDGRLVAGLLLREEGEVLVLADSQGKEVRIERDLVDERVLSQLSPMPANFADQIAEADFYHLLGYLLSPQPPQAEGSDAKQ